MIRDCTPFFSNSIKFSICSSIFLCMIFHTRNLCVQISSVWLLLDSNQRIHILCNKNIIRDCTLFFSNSIKFSICPSIFLCVIFYTRNLCVQIFGMPSRNVSTSHLLFHKSTIWRRWYQRKRKMITSKKYDLRRRASQPQSLISLRANPLSDDNSNAVTKTKSTKELYEQIVPFPQQFVVSPRAQGTKISSLEINDIFSLFKSDDEGKNSSASSVPTSPHHG